MASKRLAISGQEEQTYRLIPLTPVHIGSGQQIAPEEYVVDGRELVRLDLRGVLRTMDAAARQKYEQAIDGGRLRDGQAALQRAWRDSKERPRLERYRVALGEGSYNELRQLVERPERQGAVMALPRSPYTGEVMIPGSSIKGAIRTALLNSCVSAASDPERHEEAQEARKAPQTNWNGSRLEEIGFRRGKSETERDPLRLVHVGDAAWPAKAVRVDQGVLRKLGTEPGAKTGMQIHLERLLAQADGFGGLPEARVTIRVERLDLMVKAKRALLEVAFQLKAIEECCNYFYGNRLAVEQKTFPWTAKQTGELFARCFEGGRMLLRVGRHSHFDCLSVDGFRENRHHRTKTIRTETGASRMTCEVGNTGGEASFGWVVLEPVE